MLALRSSSVASPSVMRKPTMSVTMITKVTPRAATIARSRCESRSHLSRNACSRSLNVMSIARFRSRTGRRNVEGEGLHFAGLVAVALLGRRLIARRQRRPRRDLVLLALAEAVDLAQRRLQI